MTDDPPVEYLNFKMCKEMGWTPLELMEQKKEDVEGLIFLIGTLKQFENKRKSHGR